jgi:hypothetical protein
MCIGVPLTSTIPSEALSAVVLEEPRPQAGDMASGSSVAQTFMAAPFDVSSRASSMPLPVVVRNIET